MKTCNLFCICFLLLLDACKTPKQLENEGKLILSMERTSCYGTCPIYEIKLFDNGLLLYNGKKYVSKTGVYFAKCTKHEVNDLSNFILNSGFFDLENKYPVNIFAPSDLTECTIYFSNKNMEKRIEEHSMQTPRVLTFVEARIDSFVASKKLQTYDK